MSSGYNIFPLGQTFSNEEGAFWVTGIGLELPAGWQQSRIPTPEDFRAALSEWKECDYREKAEGDDLTIWAERRGDWDITIIFITDYAERHTELNTSSWLSFNNGRPEWLVAVTERLAQRCGPFLLTDSGGTATVVASGTMPNVRWVDLP